MKNKFAFTLAEVLITLVIIGVVAALTIPTAINKYKDNELKSQFKKAYSSIHQAFNKTEMYDFYGYAHCYYGVNAGGAPTSTDCTAFYNAFTKNLSLQKVCKGNSRDNGCIPEYQSFNTNDSCNGYNENSINTINYSYVLADGMIIMPYKGGMTRGLFLVDINGHKGPNAYGKDLFSFIIYKENTGVFLKNGGCEFPVEGGRTTAEMVKYSLAGIK